MSCAALGLRGVDGGQGGGREGRQGGGREYGSGVEKKETEVKRDKATKGEL